METDEDYTQTCAKRLPLLIKEYSNLRIPLEEKLLIYGKLKLFVVPGLPEKDSKRGRISLREVESKIKKELMDKVLELYTKSENKSLFLKAIYDSARKEI